ncbi:hypothetical protein [Anaerotruncus colihominis]|uniref:hypothetical protein n=1 Tax=Anaerotruncus colihominis TaxID=169435 RepID=UPI0013A5F3EC|nr:hypothetical protein [Anaerotruncus colihominis]
MTRSIPPENNRRSASSCGFKIQPQAQQMGIRCLPLRKSCTKGDAHALSEKSTSELHQKSLKSARVPTLSFLASQKIFTQSRYFPQLVQLHIHTDCIILKMRIIHF